VNLTHEELYSVLKNLADVIEARKNAVNASGQTDSSYVASLFSKGDDAILKKIGEEAAETIMAAKDARQISRPENEKPQALINEVADLWFHTMIMLAQFNLRPEDVLMELKRREGVSGIAEKASRPK
jgi:phosphoribosyl-ATP pyrophosphohydrolase